MLFIIYYYDIGVYSTTVMVAFEYALHQFEPESESKVYKKCRINF